MPDPIVGLIVRCDDTGLGVQTHEMWRHLRPDVTVVVDMSKLRRHAPQHTNRYPGAIVTTWGGVNKKFDSRTALSSLGMCDVIITAETWYDTQIAALPGVSVLYLNPELYGGEPADVYWTPTSWRLASTPAETITVPLPVATDRPYRRGTGLLHVAGKQAAADRNGSATAIKAARAAGVPLTVTYQETRVSSTLGVRSIPATENYWDLYQHGDVLLLPRRYGGLSLPVQEAMAAGLAVIMTDIEPNTATWPVYPVGAVASHKVMVPAGPVRCYDPDPKILVGALRTMDDWKAEYQERSAQWAAANSWDSLLPIWEERISDLRVR